MSKNELRASESSSKKSRRKKKRRTLDVSDSSSSDSDFDKEAEMQEKSETNHIDDKISLTDDESSTLLPEIAVRESAVDQLEDGTRDKLNAIPFTKSDLTNRNDFNYRNNNNDSVDLKRVGEVISDDKKKLKTVNEVDRKNEYLGLIFENYGEDINSLRQAPDFTNKSLVILANVLKEGSAMFDVETLKTILE